MKQTVDVFKDKSVVTFYFPYDLPEDAYYTFRVELLDLLFAYLAPIREGVHKGDIVEYLTSDLYQGNGLFSFLRHKRYVSVEEDFKDLFISYSLHTKSSQNIFNGKAVILSFKLLPDYDIAERELATVVDSLYQKQIISSDLFDIITHEVRYSQGMSKFLKLSSV